MRDCTAGTGAYCLQIDRLLKHGDPILQSDRQKKQCLVMPRNGLISLGLSQADDTVTASCTCTITPVLTACVLFVSQKRKPFFLQFNDYLYVCLCSFFNVQQQIPPIRAVALWLKLMHYEVFCDQTKISHPLQYPPSSLVAHTHTHTHTNITFIISCTPVVLFISRNPNVSLCLDHADVRLQSTQHLCGCLGLG